MSAAALAAALLLGAPCGQDGFAAGQAWSVPTLEGGARVVIGRIDRLADEAVVSVAVQHPGAKPIEAGGQRLDTTVIGHLPFAEAALRRSVGRCLADDAVVPDSFDEGHKTWMNAVRREGAGWFDVTVTEVVTNVLPHAFTATPSATETN